LNSLTNAENLGVLVRNCVAFGVQGLLSGRNLREPVSAPSGAQFDGDDFSTTVVGTARLVSALRELRQQGRALHSRRIRIRRAKTLPHADFSGDCLHCVG
jgi:tRNA G18 (ribose-2'-O)-methylase SpoU